MRRAGWWRRWLEVTGDFIDDRVDVVSIEQLVSLAVLGLGGSDADARRAALRRIVTRYNEIVSEVETDPSLRIDLG